MVPVSLHIQNIYTISIEGLGVIPRGQFLYMEEMT